MMGLGNVGGLGRLGYAAANSVGWWLSGAQLDLDFANDRSFNRKTGYQASPNGLLTYTSPSPKMVYGDDGLLGYAPHNALTYSQDFSDAAWVKTDTTVSANAIVAPDGTATADLLTEGSAGTAQVGQTASAVISGVRFTVSLYLKQGNTNWLRLQVVNVSDFFRLWVNLNTGVIGTTGAGGSGAYISSSISAEGDGWYKVSITGTLPATSASVFTNTSASDNSSTRVSAGTYYAWGAQLNRGSTALDYLATTSAAKYDLPIDHDPLTHAPLGVLIEEQRTNLLTYSQEFDNASWTKNESSISATNITAPDGTATAKLLASNTNNTIHYLFVGSPPSITSGVTYTGSVFLKKGTGSTAPDWMQLSLSGASFGSIQYANFNLMTGEVGTVGAGATARIKDVGGGWYRCSITATATSTSGGSLLVAFTNNNNALGRVPAYADATTSNVCVWGAQLEAGAFATSYIQTGSAQVTRAADQVSIANSSFNWSNATGTTRVAMTLGQQVETSTRSIVVNDSNGRIMYLSGPTVKCYDGTTAVSCATALQLNAERTIAQAYGGLTQAITVDGSVPDTGNFDGTMGAASSLYIGYGVGTQMQGHIKRLTYWNSRKPDAELQALSA